MAGPSITHYLDADCRRPFKHNPRYCMSSQEMKIRAVLDRIVELPLAIAPGVIVGAYRDWVPNTSHVIAATLFLFQWDSQSLMRCDFVDGTREELRWERRAERPVLTVDIHIPRHVPLATIRLDRGSERFRLFEVVKHAVPAPALIAQVTRPVVIITPAPAGKELSVHGRASPGDLKIVMLASIQCDVEGGSPWQCACFVFFHQPHQLGL